MSASPKVHVAICHERALCGMSPRHGTHDIRTMETFFQSSASDQCGRCVGLLIKRGYSVRKLRENAAIVPRSNVVADRVGAPC